MNIVKADTRLYDICVFILRGRPLHNAHIKIIREALKRGRKVVLLIGSAFAARSERNPFTHREVIAMIRASLTPDELERVAFEPIIDTLYNLVEWQENVQRAVDDNSKSGDTIALIGHSKDKGTGFYLKLFPQWDSIGVENLDGNLSATDIRLAMFHDDGPQWSKIEAYVPDGTYSFLQPFSKTAEYANLLAEIQYYREYRAAHNDAAELIAKRLKYKTDIKHQTVDACVVQSGNILLIRRKNFPGRDLLALPGGFLDKDETIAQAVIRELREETRLKVPTPVLWGNHKMNRQFDDPHRSSRGRVITQAYLFQLPAATDFPEVKPRSDAKEAGWYPIGNLNPEHFFEDHYQIIRNLVANL